jgi:hypothetical protein
MRWKVEGGRHGVDCERAQRDAMGRDDARDCDGKREAAVRRAMAQL